MPISDLEPNYTARVGFEPQMVTCSSTVHTVHQDTHSFVSHRLTKPSLRVCLCGFHNIALCDTCLRIVFYFMLLLHY